MLKRMLFKVITESFADGLEKKVQKLLDDGWNTMGSLVVCRGRLYISMQKQVESEKEIEQDISMTRQHPDAEKLGAKNDR